MAFIDGHRARFGVAPICRVLTAHGVPIAPSGYYAHNKRLPSARAVRDQALTAEISRVFGDRDLGRGVCGVRKMWRLLHRADVIPPGLGPVARCTVQRLMRRAGLAGAVRGRRFVTTRPDPSASARPPDLVQRRFTAQAPNQLWVVDFTYVPTWAGTAFTAFVTDVFARRIVGWRTASSMPTSLPLDALEMALWTRDRSGHCQPGGRLPGLTHHSDAGSQYVALRYSDRLAQAGAVASIGTVGDSFDNALAESVIGLYKTECVRRDGPHRTVDELELATCSWVDWYNTARLHSALNYQTPVEYEQQHYRQIDPGQQPLPGQPTLH